MIAKDKIERREFENYRKQFKKKSLKKLRKLIKEEIRDADNLLNKEGNNDKT
jgi:hypothetical protein